MKICPKCRGFYFDDDEKCQNCHIELMDKELFNQIMGEFQQMKFDDRIKHRYEPRYEIVCKYQYTSDYEYDEEQSHREIEAMKQRAIQKQIAQTKLDKETNLPKCPTCGSTNVNKISGTKKAVGFLTVGVFSSNFGKTMECKNCGYKW